MTSTIYDIFCTHLRRNPEKTAVIVDNRQVSYAELGQQVNALSHGLANLGIHTGDHMGVLLPNCPEYIVLMLTAANMGVVLVPLNMSLGANAIARAFTRAKVRHCIAWGLRAEELLNQPEIQQAVPGVWITVGDEVSGLPSCEKLIASRPDQPLSFQVDIQAPYILTMTSGSTGDPKPIMLSQATKLARARCAMELYDVTEMDITLAATPLYHSLAERLVLIPLLSGGTSVVMTGYTTTKWLEQTQRHQVTFSILVSSQIKQILDELKSGVSAPQSLRCLVSSSERLPNGIKQELLNILPCDFHECYGTSEVAIATNLQGSAPMEKWISVGLPVPGAQVAILGKDGMLADTNEEGEIICKTDMLFSGYYGQDETTQQSMWNGYFRTGDLGRIDADGYLYFLGRAKETIITGGINVYPRDVEEVLLKHPSVQECAVVPFEDERLGEIVAAAIVGNVEAPSEIRAIRRLCAKELADYQQPRRIYRLDRLPRNAMGKVMKRQVAEDIKLLKPVSAQ